MIDQCWLENVSAYFLINWRNDPWEGGPGIVFQSVDPATCFWISCREWNYASIDGHVGWLPNKTKTISSSGHLNNPHCKHQPPLNGHLLMRQQCREAQANELINPVVIAPSAIIYRRWFLSHLNLFGTLMNFNQIRRKRRWMKHACSLEEKRKTVPNPRWLVLLVTAWCQISWPKGRQEWSGQEKVNSLLSHQNSSVWDVLTPQASDHQMVLLFGQNSSLIIVQELPFKTLLVSTLPWLYDTKEIS